MYFNYPFQCPFYGYRAEYQMPGGYNPSAAQIGGPSGGNMGPFMGGPTGGPMGGPMSASAGGPPSGPPPSAKPSKNQAQVQSYAGMSTKAIESGAIRPCKYRYVYIWLTNGMSFWAWLTYVGKKSVSGWRWTGYRWVYFGIDLRRIDSFVCY